MDYKHLDICFTFVLFATFLVSYYSFFLFKNSHNAGINAKIVPFGLFPVTGFSLFTARLDQNLENSLGPKPLPVRCLYQGSLFLIFFFTGAQSIASADLWSQINCVLSVDFHDEGPGCSVCKSVH